MKKRILIVDDEPKMLKGLERLLHDQTDKWDMVFTSSPTQVTMLLAREPFDAALLDINMPKKNGFEILNEIKTDPKICNIEVVVLTGLQDHSLKREALELGATDLLNKPVQREELIARLNSALRMKSYQDELRAQNAILEKQLIQSQKMELAGILAAGATHDLRNILMAILGHSGLAARQLGKDSPSLDSLKTIANTAGQAQRIVDQILGFAKRTEMPRSFCNLEAIVDEVLELLRVSIPKGVDVIWENTKTYSQVHADPTQMYQLLLNLCVNALQAMDYSGELRITLHESEFEDESKWIADRNSSQSCLELHVYNTGKELDIDTLDHIFDPLFTTREAKGGMGLGLCVAKRIAESHGGTITARSKPGQGTTFIVQLPVHKSEPDTSTSRIREMTGA